MLEALRTDFVRQNQRQNMFVGSYYCCKHLRDGHERIGQKNWRVWIAESGLNGAMWRSPSLRPNKRREREAERAALAEKAKKAKRQRVPSLEQAEAKKRHEEDEFIAGLTFRARTGLRSVVLPEHDDKGKEEEEAQGGGRGRRLPAWRVVAARRSAFACEATGRRHRSFKH